MAQPRDATLLNLHAGCVSWGGRGLLITGAAGCGKSALALELMAFGCGLVADDRTDLRVANGSLMAAAPGALRGRIEARFVGILDADPAPPCAVALALDLDHIEESRLPPQRSVTYLSHSVPLIWRPNGGHVAAAVLQYLKAGRSA